ncbi:DUF4412 domain-containing protein [Lewinella sp. IMCC34183]|uniref:DUF4412 domain-containing protein n=1 Tax=Lewinella sp. IMCC34183 TaxID=2248762 RepID=UPI00130064D7|nr:DUF4412 domain-containing protein [Lewinella sp. IMCC34183]
MLTFCLVAPLSAQGTVKRAKKRTERRANERIDRRIDQEVDKVFTSLFSKKKEDPQDTAAADTVTTGREREATNSVIGILGGGGEFEPFENEQSFSFTMNMTEKKRNREEHTSIRLGNTRDKIAMITAGDGGSGTAQMIFDTQTGKTTMITTDERGRTKGYRMRMPRMGRMIDAAKDDLLDHLTVERTGERRTIDGYACELVIVENTKEHTTTRSWITQDVPLNGPKVFSSVARMMGGTGQNAAAMPPGLTDIANGFPIQSTIIDGNTTYEMHITDIRTDGNVDRSLFDTGNVEIQDMGF